MNITDQLERAIDELYIAFKARKLDALMQGCPCCANDAELRRLSFTPLRELQREDLESYSWDAIWTVGDEKDYHHFIPRLLELMVREDAFQAEVVAKKLLLAKWQIWQEQERLAIESFFDAYWDAAIIIDSPWPIAADALCVLGNALDDLSPYLNRWIHSRESKALNQLLQFAKDESGNASQGFIQGAFWGERPQQMKQVASWLCSPTTLDVLVNRWLDESEGPLAAVLFEATEVIESAVRAARAYSN